MPVNEQATIHGSPGEGARMAGIARAVFPLLAALFCVGYVAGAASSTNVGGSGLILLLAGLLLLLIHTLNCVA